MSPPRCAADAPAPRTSGSELWSRLQARSAFPMSVQLGVTERCDLTCGHCRVPPPGERPDLPLPLATRLLPELADLGVVTLLLTGGEPLLHPDLAAFVALAGRLHFAVTLKTSGVHLGPERARALFDAGLTGLDVSLYSDEPEAHDRFVGRRGAFAATLASARAFAARGGRTRVATTLMDWNVGRIDGLVAMCEREGLEYLWDPLVAGRSDGDVGPLRFRAGPAAMRRLVGDRRFADPAVGGEGGAVPPERRPLCGAGVSFGYVDCRGEVRLCQALPLALGNLAGRSFREIWLESPVRRSFLELTWNDLPRCRACDLAAVCERCPGAARSEGGDLLGISLGHCQLARVKAELAEQGLAPPSPKVQNVIPEKEPPSATPRSNHDGEADPNSQP